MDLNEIDILFSKVFKINNTLIEKSEKENVEYDANDIMNLYITSNALGFLKELYFSKLKIESSGIIILARNIIEGVAVKNYINSDDFTELNRKLLEKQVHIIEYNEYKKFLDIDGIFMVEKLKRDYNDSKKYFEELLKDDFNKEILKSSLPFMNQPKMHYIDIVNKYLGVEYRKLYGVLSYYCHPNDYTYYFNKDFKPLLDPIIEIIKYLYSDSPIGKYTIKALIQLNHSSYLFKYNDLVNNECVLIYQIADVMEKNKYRLISDYLRSLALLIYDVSIDYNISLTDTLKIKWKQIFEMESYLYYLISCEHPEERIKLLYKHRDYCVLENVSLENKNYLEDAFDIYRKIYKENNDFSRFKKCFKKTTGYLIDENYNVISLTKMVNNFVNVLGNENKAILVLNYNESQMLSHANGYMWYANGGAFKDVVAVLQGIDFSLFAILSKIYSNNENSEHKNKQISNVIRNKLKALNDIYFDKIEILKVQRIDYDFSE